VRSSSGRAAEEHPESSALYRAIAGVGVSKLFREACVRRTCYTMLCGVLRLEKTGHAWDSLLVLESSKIGNP
jgi:hypothetical protein